jgi:transposase
LRQVWAEQYTEPPAPLRWRAVDERAHSAEMIASPYDPDARYSAKRGIAWVGYKVHLTETCDEGQPAVITQVLTTPATTPDCVMGPAIQQDLANRDLLPRTHLLDSGYVDADLLVTAHTPQQIDVVGPPFGSYRHQRRAGQGDDLSAFVIDWAAQQARCPQGQTRVKWAPGRDVSSDPVVRIRFHAATCRACPARPACTRAQNAPRQLIVRPHAHHEAIQAARNGRRPPRSKPRTPSGPGSRARSRKASGAVAYGTVAIWARRKAICNTSSAPPRSTWCGW